jgi:hypothetical protein
MKREKIPEIDNARATKGGNDINKPPHRGHLDNYMPRLSKSTTMI